MWLRARLSRWSGASGREALAAVARTVGVALLASLAALGLAFLLDPWLHQGVFVLFLGAVTLSAWYGGLGSGLLATAGGALAFSYFLTDPVHGQVTPGRRSADVAVFGLVSLLITLLYVRLREARRREEAARHQFRVEADPEPLIGSFDPVRLERVIDNLVSNAVKYSPLGGGVTLALRCQSTASGTWAVLTVRDEGLGIPAADLPHVFEPFRRASNVGPISGRGIGLASARQIVEQHGGRIAVTSHEGTGTTVGVWLHY